jgi:hypothetical protein
MSAGLLIVTMVLADASMRRRCLLTVVLDRLGSRVVDNTLADRLWSVR